MRCFHTVSVALLVFSTGCCFCTSSDNKERSENNPRLDEILPKEVRIEDQTNIVKEDEELKDIIKKMSQLYRLPRLAERTKTRNGMEIRLWSLPGTDYPSCLVLSRVGHQWKARLLSPRESRSRSNSNEASFQTRENISPKSGWELIGTLLEQHNVQVPLNFIRDTQLTPPIPDEGEIFLEINKDGEYDYVGYRAFTKTLDGRELLGLCAKFKIEFNISIGCFKYE